MVRFHIFKTGASCGVITEGCRVIYQQHHDELFMIEHWHKSEITFVTSIMGRTDHLKKTLPVNLINNKQAKFLILDGGPDSTIENWLYSHLWPYLISGRIIHARINSDNFHPSWFRNISILLTNTQYFCNLDADNYTDTDFDIYLLYYFEKNQNSFFAARRSSILDCHGRIAMSKPNFIKLRGYDESLGFEYGFEDIDLINRASQIGMQKIIIADVFLTAIEHPDELRSVNMKQSNIKITNYNHRISAKSPNRIINQSGFGISTIQSNCVTNIQTGLL